MPRYGELEDEKIIPEGGGYPSKESDLSSFLKERLKKAKDEAGDTLRGVAGMSPGEGRSGDTLGYVGGRMIGSVASSGLTDAYANNKERVPNIIGNIAEKFAPSDLEKKTGVATDSRLQALMNLKNKDRDFFQDVKALRKDIGGTLASTLPAMSPAMANRRVTRVAGNLPGQGGRMSHAMSPVVANRRVTRVADNAPFTQSQAFVEGFASPINKGGYPIERRMEILKKIEKDTRLTEKQRSFLKKQLDQSRENLVGESKRNATRVVGSMLDDDYVDFIDPNDYR